MRLAFLHVGTQECGIFQFGQTLAAAVKMYFPGSAVEVSERHIQFSFANPTQDEAILHSALEWANRADSLHVQMSTHSDQTRWGDYRQRIPNLRTLLAKWQKPLFVTFHDYAEMPRESFLSALLTKLPGFAGQRLLEWMFRISELLRSTRLKRKAHHAEQLFALDLLKLRASKFFVLIDSDTPVGSSLPLDRVVINPHYCKRSYASIDQSLTKVLTQHSLDHVAIVAMGFIFQRKGFDALVRAMPHIRTNIKLYFCGRVSPGAETYWDSVIDLAGTLNVNDRFVVTGYLSEEQQLSALRDAQLVVCPYKPKYSSSAIVSLVMSTGCPILANDIPMFREINARYGQLIPTCDATDPVVLARNIDAILATPSRYVNECKRRTYCEDHSLEKFAAKYFQEVRA